MNRLISEYRHFLSYPRDMRVLLATNMIYALVLPVIDIFVAAYIMRNSHEVSRVVTYQLAVYTGIPFTFLINGLLLNRFPIRSLYSLGMMMSGFSMLVLTSVSELSVYGIGLAGLLMGMAQGLFWANRGFLALSTTTDDNRNYYYGVETAFYTVTFVIVPPLVGWFIEYTGINGWFGGRQNVAYQIVTACVFAMTIVSSVIVHKGRFINPERSRFVYFRFHPLWNRILALAGLKGIAQGYIVTAPAMLIMRLVGQEGTLGTLQSAGAIISAGILYVIGRSAKPQHRIWIFAIGLSLFAAGSLANAVLFNATGVLLFMLFLLMAKPLLDVAYFPIQFQVTDIVSALEKRNKFAYILNHEFGLYFGRLAGCALFILLAIYGSDVFALRYALLIIALVQMLSLPIARCILRRTARLQELAVHATT